MVNKIENKKKRGNCLMEKNYRNAGLKENRARIICKKIFLLQSKM